MTRCTELHKTAAGSVESCIAFPPICNREPWVALPFFPAGTCAGSGAGGEAGSGEICFTGRSLSVTSGEGGWEERCR